MASFLTHVLDVRSYLDSLLAQEPPIATEAAGGRRKAELEEIGDHKNGGPSTGAVQTETIVT
jgi:hypothetical protein